MNYRHAFHAGNWCDVMKHALLAACVRRMQVKPGGVLFLDTHAGAGAYDLGADAALRTGEWQSGILSVRGSPAPALAHYLALTAGALSYPGSPALLRNMLRPQDRLVCCELLAEDARTLRDVLSGEPRAGVHQRDGYAALRAFLPPPERRGLVLLDPPYEAPDEFSRVTEALREGVRRFPPGVLCAWYPVKGFARARAFLADVAEHGPDDAIACELFPHDTDDAARLTGCGLLVVNPPFGFEAMAGEILAALVPRLARDGRGRWDVRRVRDE